MEPPAEFNPPPPHQSLHTNNSVFKKKPRNFYLYVSMLCHYLLVLSINLLSIFVVLSILFIYLVVDG